MDEQNKNLLLAMGLSLVVILAWFWMFPPPEADVAPESAITNSDGTPAVVPGADATTGAVADTIPGVTTAESREATLAEAPRIDVRSDRLSGTISLVGGRIDDLKLSDYRETTDPDSPTVTLLTPEGTPDAYYALFGWSPGGGLAADLVPGAETTWAIESGDTLAPGQDVTLVWDNGADLTFRRTLSLDEDYMFTVTQSVTNNGAAAARMAPYGLLARHGEPSNLKGFFILHEGAIRQTGEEMKELDYGKLQDLDTDPRWGQADVADVTSNGWIGFTDHYWMTTLIPAADQAFTAALQYDANRDIYRSTALLETMDVAPGATVEVSQQLFAGAKEWETIREYENEGGVYKFIDSIDWGWFFFLTKPIFWLLHNLHNLIGNMGWSIIALTLLIKAALFPLAFKSYVSMAKMKELQPQMEKIKESAGEDRQKVQTAMMELYKKEKVNPASGCLPILMQIPIFFSLYKVIFVTIELRQAAWFGPFQDLSMPDPTSIMNLFGLLPNAGPDANTIMATVFIGILPLILGISMWLQQKLNPAPTDPAQAMIFAWMPWVFMFMLGSFASGLVVYWIANNTITFTQQYLIMRSQGFKPDVFGNILSTFKRKTPEDK